ncbi:MAG: hypothetical protein ABW007_02100 [Chitinophagaceae bacterium]
MKPIVYSMTVELIVPGVTGTGNQQTTFDFNNQPFLRNKLITSLEVFSSNDILKTPQQNTPVSIATIKSAFLTLEENKTDINVSKVGTHNKRIPLICLHNVESTTGGEVDTFSRHKYEMEPRTIIWEKSSVILGQAIGNEDQESFLFNVGYIDNPNFPND